MSYRTTFSSSTHAILIGCCLVVTATGCGKAKTNNEDMGGQVQNDLSTTVPPDLSTTTSMDDLVSPPPPDLAPICTATAGCQNGSGNLVCKSGACAACVDTTDDAACVTAYGAGFKCIAGACITAECHGATDCGGRGCTGGHCDPACTNDGDCPGAGTVCNTTSGACVTNASCGAASGGAACPINANDLCCGASGSAVCAAVDCCGSGSCGTNGTCQAGVCVPSGCTAPSGNTRYVDSNAANSNGTGSKDCPLKTIGAAITALTATGGTIYVKAGSQITATNSRLVPSGVDIKGATSTFDECTESTCAAASWPTITLDDGHRGFTYQTTGARTLAYFTIKGPTSSTTFAGVYAEAATLTLDHVHISSFNDGIAVGAGATVNIKSDVLATGNSGNGLFVNGGTAKVTVTAGQKKTSFDDNLNGIWVQGSGLLTVSAGTPATSNALITANNNDVHGVRFASTNASQSSIDGLAIEGNGKTGGTAAGFLLYADAKLKVRNSTIKDSGKDGVYINDNGTNSVKFIDFGATPSGAGAGNNTIATNKRTGFCIEGAVANSTADDERLQAQGNFWNNNLNCQTTAGELINANTCSNENGQDYAQRCNTILLATMCTGKYKGAACQARSK